MSRSGALCAFGPKVVCGSWREAILLLWPRKFWKFSVLLYLEILYVRPAVKVGAASINEERNNKSEKEKRGNGRESESADTHAQLVYTRKEEKQQPQACGVGPFYRTIAADGFSARAFAWASAALGRLVGCSLHQAQHDHSGAATTEPQVRRAHLVGLREAMCDMRSSRWSLGQVE